MARTGGKGGRGGLLTFLAATGLALSGPGGAQERTDVFDVTHEVAVFDLRGGTISNVEWVNFQHAWVSYATISARPWVLRPPQSSVVDPVVQPPGFGDYGNDRARMDTRIENFVGGASPILANRNVVDVPPTGLVASNGVGTATPPDYWSVAANTSIDVSGWSSTEVRGTTREWGHTFPAKERGGEGVTAIMGYAFAASHVILQGTGVGPSGRIDVVPGVNLLSAWDTGRLSTQSYRVVDPILIQILDTDGKIIGEDLLWEMSTVLSPASGHDFKLEFRHDGMTLDAPAGSGEGEIHVFSGGLRNQGEFDLEFRDGIITKSSASGIFGGVFPSVGMPAVFDTPFPAGFGELEFAPTARGESFRLIMGAGFGDVPAVPEPETWALMVAGLGILGAIRRRRPS